MSNAVRLEPADLAGTDWRVVRSPVPAVVTKGLDRLYPAGDLTATWHEIAIDPERNPLSGARALLRIVEDRGDGPAIIGVVVVDELATPAQTEAAETENVQPPETFVGDVDTYTLRSVPVAAITSALRARLFGAALLADLELQVGREMTIPVEKPQRGAAPYPEFYPAVAARYLRLVAEGKKGPVQRLAAESKVSHPTAQRWVVDARRRGLLPEARKGQAL